MQHIQLTITYVLMCSATLSKAQTYYYYTNYSNVVNSGQCSGANCRQCPTGQFNLNCGMDANHLNADNCQPCSNAPTNAQYLPWGTASSVGSSSSVCKWACNYRYNLTSTGQCVPGNCSNPTGFFDLAPGTLWPECNTTCKAGYIGSRVVDPPTCTQCVAGTYSVSASTTCTNCPIGKYSSVAGGAGSSSCLQAPPGYYVSTPGSTTFLPCPAGLWSGAYGLTTDGDCSSCPTGAYCVAGSSAPTYSQPGYYNNKALSTVSTDNKPCPPGTYSDIAGATACKQCNAGKFSANSGASSESACLTCSAGGYCGVGASSVTLCPGGTYSSLTGQFNSSTCQTCQAGYYCAAGSSAQTPCSTGTYSQTVGGQSDSVCLNCGQGTYMDQTSATVCTKCPAGKFSSTTKAVALSFCQPCPAGSYCLEGSSTATKCPPGKFTSLTEQTSELNCQTCQLGYYCGEGSSVQSACPTGTFSIEVGGTSDAVCKQCPQATYNDGTAATVCTNCTAGKYSAAYAATSVSQCLPCPPGKYCPVASIQGIDCPVGTYNRFSGRQVYTDCQNCDAPVYSDVTGLSACKDCALCTTVGQFRTGCGGSTAGTCASCSNSVR